MADNPKVLAFAGSARRESYNKQIIGCAARAMESLGAAVQVIDLSDYPLPVFDEDLEAGQGRPDAAKQLTELFCAHDGLVISSPEYNSSLTALLKNTIDWVSRPVSGEPPLVAFRGKVAGLCSASPGALGGLRGLVHLRAILGNMGMYVIPDQVSVPKAHEAFDGNGSLKDAAIQSKIETMAQAMTETTRRLRA